jgi:predicted alpha/beta-hydrolase family hydrolase
VKVVGQSPRFEELKVRLPEPLNGVEEISAVLGTPEWWPSGARVAVAIAHGAAGDLNDPLIADLHRRLAEQRFMSLRFNFPFGEAGRRSGTDSLDVMEQAFRAALSVLGRDPTKAPAHLILGGKGVGAKVAAQLAQARVRVDGLFFLGYPLHPRDRKEDVQAESLYRITAPMLFVQGTRDRHCDIDVLRATLRRIGASTRLHVSKDADRNFNVPKRSPRTDEEVRTEISSALHNWLGSIVREV